MAAPIATASPEAGISPKGWLGRAIETTLGFAKSWVGLTTAYFVAVAAAVTAFQKLPEPLKSYPLWLRVTLLSAPPLLAFAFQAVPEMLERKRNQRLMEITGHLQAAYFQVAPRDDAATFFRVDGVHEEILRWIEKRIRPILYITGLSGSGKSSLLAAYVVPRLQREDTVVIRLRGYQDPIKTLEQELLRPGVIWQKPPNDVGDLKSLILRTCRFVRPKRLFVIFDQFEEFAILQKTEKQNRFDQFVSELSAAQVGMDLTLLFVFRSDYIGLMERLALPPLIQNTNWKEVPPFTESAARDFIQGSGLKINDDLLRDLLREAAEIEQTKGLIRPVTINLCGLVLGRFVNGLPRSFRPGRLIRGFLRESILLPEIRNIAPALVPHLISEYVTKRPRSVTELAVETGNDPKMVQGCLRVLGRSDRAIVRPLDEDQQVWEISHDFLVPLLDSITAPWKVSLWRSLRSWLPWIMAMLMAAAVLVAATWKSDPISDLVKLGWKVQETDSAITLEFAGSPPRQSRDALQRTTKPLSILLPDLHGLSGLSGWGTVKNLTELKLCCAGVSDVSPLKNLKSLTELDLSGSQVSDISPLKDLKSLTTLSLGFTRVTDISSLKDLKSLTTLKLTGTAVSDLSSLKDLNSLTTLRLDGTAVSDLSPLKDLNSLTTLDLSGTRVTDISPMKDLRGLITLKVGETAVSDLSPLKDLNSLTTLELMSSRVSDLSPLKDLKNLTALELISCRVSDLSPLKDLNSLTTLELNRSRVSDLSPLKDLKSLTTLDVSSTRVTDLSPLKDLKSLTALNIEGTAVAKLSPLKDLNRLTILQASGTAVSDVSPLQDLKSLKLLELSATRVSDLSPLKNLKSLRVLALGGSKVRDVSPLKDLKNLTISGAR